MPYITKASEFLQDHLPRLIQASNELQALGVVVKFDIEDDDATPYYVNFADGSVSHEPSTPKVIVRARGLDFMAMIEGRMSAQDGLLTGRLHLAGEIATISALTTALDQVSKGSS